MTARRGYPAVDRFRVAAALLVVCIHTAPLASFSAAADFALKTLARLAVPFFFTATGFFLLGELVRPGLRSRTLSPGVRRFLKKTGVLYAACTVLYLPVTLYAGNFPVENVLGELVRDAVLDGTFYHLWYLPAALLGVLVVCGLLRFLRPGAAAGVCGALYLAGLLGDSWYGLAKQLPALKEGYDALFGVMDYTRNGLFFAPAFLMLGALLAGFPARRRPRACLAGAGLAPARQHVPGACALRLLPVPVPAGPPGRGRAVPAGIFHARLCAASHGHRGRAGCGQSAACPGMAGGKQPGPFCGGSRRVLRGGMAAGAFEPAAQVGRPFRNSTEAGLAQSACLGRGRPGGGCAQCGRAAGLHASGLPVDGRGKSGRLRPRRARRGGPAVAGRCAGLCRRRARSCAGAASPVKYWYWAMQMRPVYGSCGAGGCARR